MGFCFALAVLNGYVQLTEREIPKDLTEKIASLQDQLDKSEKKLLVIKSAANPILNARGNIVDRLPPSAERDTVLDLLKELRLVLG